MFEMFVRSCSQNTRRKNFRSNSHFRLGDFMETWWGFCRHGLPLSAGLLLLTDMKGGRYKLTSYLETKYNEGVTFSCSAVIKGSCWGWICCRCAVASELWQNRLQHICPHGELKLCIHESCSSFLHFMVFRLGSALSLLCWQNAFQWTTELRANALSVKTHGWLQLSEYKTISLHDCPWITDLLKVSTHTQISLFVLVKLCAPVVFLFVSPWEMCRSVTCRCLHGFNFILVFCVNALKACTVVFLCLLCVSLFESRIMWICQLDLSLAVAELLRHHYLNRWLRSPDVSVAEQRWENVGLWFLLENIYFSVLWIAVSQLQV